MTDMRLESDSLGQVEVPADKLWGAQNVPASTVVRLSGKTATVGDAGQWVSQGGADSERQSARWRGSGVI